MKTLTCAQFGGPCDFKMTAATEKEMSAMCWKHVKEAHPERFEETKIVTKDATKEQDDQAAAYFHNVWESVPEDK
ncbi:MAG: DUF1059 domain-containing protein [Patescibacteria group bacterium]|jgi:predicted small metal-binding protein